MKVTVTKKVMCYLAFLHGFLLLHFTAVGQTLTSSRLPICIINTKGNEIPDEPKLNANLKIIYNGPGIMNNVTDQNYHYNNAIGIEKRGNSSQSFEQLQYGIETRDSVTGANLDFPLLGMPADNDWVLYAPYNDISMIRNVIAYHLWDKMGHWGPRTRMCEVILNGEYQGVYVLVEKIKKAKDRVDIAKLKPEDISGVDVTGGYILKIDAQNNPDDKSFISNIPGIKAAGGFGSNTVIWQYHYPKATEIQPEQEAYIKDYIHSLEALIQSDNFADTSTGYPKYLSLQSFIDYFIHTELSRNADGYKRSAYFYKEKQKEDGTKGKLKAGSVWDYNLAYGNANFCGANQIEGWVYQGCETLPTPALWRRLTEDPNFVNAVKCRYEELRKTILSQDYLHTLIDQYANDSLQEAQARHFEKFPDLLVDDPQNHNGGGFGFGGSWLDNFNGYRVVSYSDEIDTLKGWFDARLAWLDANLTGTCPIVTATKTSKSADIKLYPNPTSGSIILEASSPITNIGLYDTFGNKLPVSFSSSSENAITSSSLQQFQDGIYYLKFEVDGVTQYKKVVKTE